MCLRQYGRQQCWRAGGLIVGRVGGRWAGWTGAWDKTAVQRLPGRGTHESSEERVELQESFTTFVVRSMTQERIWLLFATSSTFSEDSDKSYPEIYTLYHKNTLHCTTTQVSPKKKRLCGTRVCGTMFPGPIENPLLILDNFLIIKSGSL